MKGIDYGMGRARVDFLFDEALARGIPVVDVGDGGNEIGMGKVAGHVKAHVPYGDTCQWCCGGGHGDACSRRKFAAYAATGGASAANNDRKRPYQFYPWGCR